MVDSDGFRPNVGIIVANSDGMLLWARRCGQDAWQFPQGGIEGNETPLDALYRELAEEIGLSEEDVAILGATQRWLKYRLPRRMIRRTGKRCIGQKQIWFLLRLLADEQQVRLDGCPHPEFDNWRWVDYWRPVEEVIFFKRRVYRQALEELSIYLRQDLPSAGGTVEGRAVCIPPAAKRRVR
ncbi:RNA pyrophosphohydrolase [Halorhodospira halochloris]|uniref:RNA pyrophosphohydrolase n=1 Tax=Halorhodospira halochloris TaxID=1052 RepID=UPI00076F7D64|nr:RNA pyrophosphohydrolase [Halorhodospira halochloris]MBK1652428.1 RNA pyrophosphohydrolase [Halorhodospira halochloris]